MDTKEFRKRLLRAYVRSEYFYLPFRDKEPVGGIFIAAFDDDGNPVNGIVSISLSYDKYQLYHDLHKDPDTGSWVVDIDRTSKGYAFETNYDWRYVVPNPSQFEFYPVPDLTQFDISAENAIVSASSSSVTVTPNNMTSLVHVENLPAGVYSISVTRDSNRFRDISYYPDYYNNEQHPVDHSRASTQIDRHGRFSGFYIWSLSDPNDGHPTGYDFYGITTKFADNTMPVTLYPKYNIRVVFGFISMTINADQTYNRGVSKYHPNLQKYSGGVCRASHRQQMSMLPVYKFYVDDEYRGMIGADTLSIYYVINPQLSYDSDTGEFTTIWTSNVQSYLADEDTAPALIPFSDMVSYAGSSYTNNWDYELVDGRSDVISCINGVLDEIQEIRNFTYREGYVGSMSVNTQTHFEATAIYQGGSVDLKATTYQTWNAMGVELDYRGDTAYYKPTGETFTSNFTWVRPLYTRQYGLSRAIQMARNTNLPLFTGDYMSYSSQFTEQQMRRVGGESGAAMNFKYMDGITIEEVNEIYSLINQPTQSIVTYEIEGE